ncbi:MAG: hypothetical protein JRJ75_17745 [Deltaproteobacteria bacterium]|nr:hypothetical protein [Deltaproteobacteria bacterium]
MRKLAGESLFVDFYVSVCRVVSTTRLTLHSVSSIPFLALLAVPAVAPLLPRQPKDESLCCGTLPLILVLGLITAGFVGLVRAKRAE